VAAKNPYDFSIVGVVSVAPTPEIAVATQGAGAAAVTDNQPTAIEVGSVALGASSLTRTFSVTNSGNAPLTLGAVTVPAGFTVTEPLSATIAPGASDTFTVALASATVGDKFGQVSFSNNDADESPFNFPIHGTVVQVGAVQGPDITVLLEGGDVVPPQGLPVEFGNSTFGQPGSTRRFIVRNDGTAPLGIAGVSATSGFTIVEPLATVLQPGESDGFTVAVATDLAGQRTGSVSITSSDPDESPFTISLRGNVVITSVNPNAELTVLVDGVPVASGESIDFGETTLGGISPGRDVTLRNDGSGGITLSEPILPSGFTLSGASPLMVTEIPPGQSITFRLALSSQVSGTYAGPATIITNDADEGAFVLNLSGVVSAPSAVSAVVVSNVTGRVPPVVIAGSRQARGVVSFTVTNTNSTVGFAGDVVFTVLASTDNLAGPNDAVVGTVTRKLKLKPGASRTIRMRLMIDADTPQGQKTLLVRASAVDGSSVGVGPSLMVQEGFVRLTGLVGAAPTGNVLTLGRRARFVVPVQNAGNIQTSRTPVAYELTVTRDGTPATQVFQTTTMGRINLRPGASRPQRIVVTFPPGAFAPGSYVLIVKLAAAEGNQTNGQNLAFIPFIIS
jgi:hypothetical protein